MVKITLGVIIYRKSWGPFQITQGQNLILNLGAYYLDNIVCESIYDNDISFPFKDNFVKDHIVEVLYITRTLVCCIR